MRKAVAAITVGLLLVAGQAAAAGSNGAVARVGDRLGARTTAAVQTDSPSMFFGMPPAVGIIGGAVLIGVISIVVDNGESD